MNGPKIAKRLSIEGIVQGVGFRPFIYQLAQKYDLTGYILNTVSGVSITVEGLSIDIASFLTALLNNPPPLAHIIRHEYSPIPITGYTAFTIRESRQQHQRNTLVSPDISVCSECLAELYRPGDRRFRYPFINCTHCGPRFSIIHDIPYDRNLTAMKSFSMCPACLAEYNDPSNRRFHAQPNACPNCGPQVALVDHNMNSVKTETPVETAIQRLKKGHILAIKGLGGFHLAVDATNASAVALLRHRKKRPEKPLALMAPDLERITDFAHMTPKEKKILFSRERPIVLLTAKTPSPLAHDIAPGNPFLGVMLPYTPLHTLLLNEFMALVMTSANLPGAPMVIANEEAFTALASLADFFLLHDRPILHRCDDSIIQVQGETGSFIRRSRGFVPTPIFLPQKLPSVLACGGTQKNTFCLIKKNLALISQHIGDLENAPTYDFYQTAIRHYQKIFHIDPEIIAHDMHPDYLSTQYARSHASLKQCIPVQHHHAHIVSCMAEHAITRPVLGICLDGAGYGTDGQIWGGEILLTEPCRFKRLAHLSYCPMPGGHMAIREPYRMAVAYLYQTFGHSLRTLDLPFLKTMATEKINALIQMIDKGINVPMTSSMGRLFDGIAALMGLRTHITFEGQAAMDLTAIATAKPDRYYAFEWSTGPVYCIPIAPLIKGVVEDLTANTTTSVISTKFHNTLAHLFTALCDSLRKEYKLNTIVLSGGVFQNMLLRRLLIQELSQNSFDVYFHQTVPTNDGGLSLGQAIVAASLIQTNL